MMHMTFYWGKNVTILFDSWRTATWTGYLLSLVALLVVSAFYQYLESFRIRVKLLTKSKPAKKQIEDPLLSRSKPGKYSAARLVGAALFGANSAIGYMLMLAVMSFNGGVFVAVVVGLAVGYLGFRSGPTEEEERDEEENACACS